MSKTTVAELKAQVYTRLLEMGYNIKMNQRFPLPTRVPGFKVVSLDLVVKDKRGEIKALFYIGKRKGRRVTKYQMLRIKIFYIEEASEVEEVIRKFQLWFIHFLYP